MTPPAILEDITRQDILDGVKWADSPAEMKQLIMYARELGLIDDEETADWIAAAGLKHD